MSFKNYANSFQKVPNLGLERISYLMELLNNPQDKLRFVHIAGTNGKGSVSSMISNALTLSGLKTGKFISPNMVKVNERISVDGKDITDEELEKIFAKIEVCSEKVFEKFKEKPSQFEIWTAAAFCCFFEQKCDIVVLEVGLGGRLDATNVIKNPKICIITKLGYDHTSLLGNTIEEIAGEKAAIIKKGAKVITSGFQQESALKVITEKCRKENCNLIVTDNYISEGKENFNEIFSYKSFKNVKSGLAGIYQIENALMAIEALNELGIDEATIKKGFLNAKNPGRFEILSSSPVIIYDGAHNENGIKGLVKNIERYFNKDETFTFICAFMADKDIDTIFEILKENKLQARAKMICTTVKNNERAMSPCDLLKIADKAGFDAVCEDNISLSLKSAGEKKNPTIIFGSLYLYKDLKEN